MLDDAGISDDQLTALAGLTLRELTLTNNPITDAGLKHLENMQTLRRLRLDKTEVTQSGIERLRKAMPKCRIRWSGNMR